MGRLIRLTENELKYLITESVKTVLTASDSDLNQYVPKKAFKMVEKVNNELKQLKELTQEEYPELLDTSSGTEIFFRILSDVTIQNGCLTWDEESGEYWKKDRLSHENWSLVSYDKDYGYSFDEYTFKDQITYLRNGIKKAIKYFQEYNPDWDEDENQRTEFLDSL